LRAPAIERKPTVNVVTRSRQVTVSLELKSSPAPMEMLEIADSALQDWPCAYIARGAHISHSGAQLTHHAAKGVMADEKLLARQSQRFYRPLLLFLPHSC
jgi:hypothetical protein